MAMMGWSGHGTFGWDNWLLISVMMLIIWVGIAVTVIQVWRSRWREEKSSTPEARQDARRLLDERFARGEIDPDDYIRRRELLRSDK
jgi:putative membrane protein